MIFNDVIAIGLPQHALHSHPFQSRLLRQSSTMQQNGENGNSANITEETTKKKEVIPRSRYMLEIMCASIIHQCTPLAYSSWYPHCTENWCFWHESVPRYQWLEKYSIFWKMSLKLLYWLRGNIGILTERHPTSRSKRQTESKGNLTADATWKNVGTIALLPQDLISTNRPQAAGSKQTGQNVAME